MGTYQLQRWGVFALAVTFLVLMGILALGYGETREAHDRVTRALELESHLSFSRVWVNRGSTEVLASIISGHSGDGSAFEGDRVRARAELQSIRDLVASDPAQVARVEELSVLLERRFAMEKGAAEAARQSGTAAGSAILEAGAWRSDRDRVRTITAVMLESVRQDLRLNDARRATALAQIRVAMAVGIALMACALAFLLWQVRAAQRDREETGRARDLARERLEDLAGVLETVPVAVLICHDRAGRRLEGNRFAGELFRIAPGQNFSQSAPADERPPIRFERNGAPVPAHDLPVQIAAREGVAVDDAPLDALFGDGTMRHILGKARPLLDGSGQPRGAVGAFVDVTEVVRRARELQAALDENRRLLAAVRRSELLYREMARNFPNGSIGLFDHDLRFVLFGGTQLAMKRDPESTIGRTLAEILPPEVVAQIEPSHRGALAGVDSRVEVVIQGRTLVILVRPIRDETGAVVMGLAMTQDVTEQRLLRAQLALSSRLASLGTLVAGVAHEVNNPLASAIASVAHAIEEQRALASRIRGDQPLDREALALAAEAVVEVLLDAQVGEHRISQIVKDLSLFGHPNPMRTRVRLGDVVTSAMRWIPASVGRSATVRVDDLGAPDVHASAGQLEQVVVNLVTNAAFAIPDGSRGEVTVRIFTSDAGGAVLEVHDDGTGIDPAIMERIFDPFFTTRDVGKGTGLGLPVCHAIVSAHAGTLTATSVVGKGSTFRVELPPGDTHGEATPPGSRV